MFLEFADLFGEFGKAGCQRKIERKYSRGGFEYLDDLRGGFERFGRGESEKFFEYFALFG